MASLLMPTRKACGRYVCHDVSVTIDRTYLNSCTGSKIRIMSNVLRSWKNHQPVVAVRMDGFRT